MKPTNLIKLACLLPVAIACGAADETYTAEASAPETTANEGAPEVEGAVATAELGYGTVYFQERANADGTVAIGVGELVPGNYGTTPVQRLFLEGHTALEVFKAVLPNVEPPASYFDAHRIQAAELGRQSDELRTAVFDAEAPIEKSVTWCRNIATPTWVGQLEYEYSGRMSSDDVYGSQSLTLAAGKKAVAPAICNETSSSKTSSHTVQGRVRMKRDGGSYDSPGWTPQLGEGWAWYWLGLQLIDYTYCDDLPPGSLCLGRAVDSTYRLEGKSNTSSSNNTYDLYIAKIDDVTDHTIIR